MARPTRSLLDRARARHKTGDASGALALYRRFLKHHQDQPDALLLAAMAATQAGRLEQAERFARRAVAARPDVRSYLTLGQVLGQRRSWQGAITALERAKGDKRVVNDVRFETGRALRHLDRLEEAEAQLAAVVAEVPGHAPAWNELGIVQMGRGRPHRASESFRQSLAIRPDHAGTCANLSRACLEAGSFEDASKAVDRALTLDEDHRGALAVRGDLAKLRGRLEESRIAYDRLTSLEDTDVDAWVGLAATLQAQGDMAAAGAAYDRALAISPGNAAAKAGRAEWLEWQGRYREGLESLATGEQDDPAIALTRGRLLRRIGKPQQALDALETVLQKADQNVVVARPLYFSLGEVCDELGRYEDAFRFFERGNALVPATYDRESQRQRLKCFDELGAGEGRVGDRVLFVIGMPRSGTTLVEQILAAHPAVHAGGESAAIGALAATMRKNAVSLSAGQAKDLGNRYLEQLPDVDTRWITDKMPMNFQYLGLIQRVLPGARIIHCRRDPRDTALSCYFTDFIDPALGFATRLDWLVDWSNRYRRHMADWRARLAIPMLELDYESLVEEPEVWSRRLIEFIGLDWDPACLEFQTLGRDAHTASHAQVRKPVYRTSVGRWRQYERQLTPFIEALDD